MGFAAARLGEGPRIGRSAHRAGRNEALFRTINEETEELGERLHLEVEFVCECERLSCLELLKVPLGEYLEVREHPDWFLIATGHEHPEHEVVVEERSGYLIVRKVGEAADELRGPPEER